MTLAELIALYWVAKLGSFRAAADHVHMSQPTISLRIRNLESKLNTQLFKRAGKRVLLTCRGSQLMGYAVNILALADEAQSSVTKADPFAGSLRVGTVDSFAMACISEILLELTTQFPELKIDLTVNHTVALQQLLLEEQIDIALLGDPIPNDDILLMPLTSLRFAWVAPPKMKFGRKILRPKDLAPLQILTTPLESRIFCIMKQWFMGAGIDPLHVSTCSSLGSIVAVMKGGFGISMLPVYSIIDELRRGALKEIKTTPTLPDGSIAIARLKSRGYLNYDPLIKITQRVLKLKLK
jgi:DNA-binding transcriptional LysR family regulator